MADIKRLHCQLLACIVLIMEGKTLPTINTYTEKKMKVYINYKASSLVKAGIDSVRTFGRALTPAQQVRALKAHSRAGITVYFHDGDWGVYRIK